jgi:hypothetical protein
MSVANNDILHVVIEGVMGNGTIVQNRHRFKASFASPLSDSVVLNAVKTWVETLYAFPGSQISVNTSLADGSVDIITWNAGDAKWEVTSNVGLYSPLDVFADVNEVLPHQCAAFIIGNTSRPKSKGRHFVFPYCEDTQAGGILTTAALTALGNMAAQYILDQPIASDELISGIVREAANEFLPFTSATVSDYIGTQRRRRFGIGK